MNVYSLLDRKLRQFGQLILERNDYSAQRSLADGIASSGESLIGKHPEDFDLYQVGEYDDESGMLEGMSPPRLVCCAVDLVSGESSKPSLLKEG